MRRLVIDTNVYIDWFNAGRHDEIVFQRDTVKHLSVVVLMELRAGAFSASDRRLVRRVESAFEKTGRRDRTDDRERARRLGCTRFSKSVACLGRLTSDA